MPYVATMSQSQNRKSWAVIFRHPGVADPSTGKLGLRLRRGLGTESREEAERLVDELNQLLAEETYWTPAARALAAERFSPRAVEIFFDPMSQSEATPYLVRERLLPATSAEGSDPRRVLLIGTTGAGKTTLLRQLIGTTPEERFPATSKAKTTFHDTEILVQAGPYRAAVTFLSEAEVREYLAENLIEAVKRILDGADSETVYHTILDHRDQGVRFSYTLGTGPESNLNAHQRPVGAKSANPQQPQITASVAEHRQSANALLSEVANRLRELSGSLEPTARAASAKEDSAELERQAFEETIEREARSDERFHLCLDDLIDEVGKRFDLLDTGTFSRRSTGWPTAWTLEEPDREAFLAAIRRFSSNHHLLHGVLLTPLVNGIRAAGPFHPAWDDGPLPAIVYLDGEGLGHTPETATSLPTVLIERMREADEIVLVDHGEVPMQAASATALREIYAAGQMAKLHVVFTHMDRLDADNLPTQRSRELHVLASARSVAGGIRDALGSVGGALAERAVRRVLDERTAFLSSLDAALGKDEQDPDHTDAVDALRIFFTQLTAASEPIASGPAVPVYSLFTLGLAVHQAVQRFMHSWGGLLGRRATESRSAAWQTVKAMNRRMALWPEAEGYGKLVPIADFRSYLMDELAKWVHAPVRWENGTPTDDEREMWFNRFEDAIVGRLSALARTRIKEQHHLEWRRGIEAVSGTGSTRERARLIHDEILSRAAPAVDVALNEDSAKLLQELRTLILDAAKDVGAMIDAS